MIILILITYIAGLISGILLTFRTLRRRGFIFMKHSDWVYTAKRTAKK